VPSSTSSSDSALALTRANAGASPPDRYARQTAADRPGIAQPVPLRPVPEQPWGRIFAGAILIFTLLLGGWEAYWRAYGVHPGITNTYGLWALQRRRIDAGEGNSTVLLGSSRVFFDIQLPVWERLAGRRPIQLAIEGTSPVPFLEDLANDPRFTGRVLVGVAPDLFFSGYQYRGGVLRYVRKESPSQRVGQWLSMHLIEPRFAFDDPDYALATVLARQPWPARRGKRWFTEVRKLAETESDRNTHLWSKVGDDPAYREMARNIWREGFQPSADDPTPTEAAKTAHEQIERAAKAVAKLRARGVRVLFVRMPSAGEYLAYENSHFPRARTWDALLAVTGAPGIYFEDYPELRPDVAGYYLPEWSHMIRADGERVTAALYRIIERDFWGPAANAATGKPAAVAPAADPPAAAPVPH
jgi:hypothetical protein